MLYRHVMAKRTGEKTELVQAHVTPEQFKKLDDWAWSHRMTRAEAIRQLLEVGMAFWEERDKEEPPG